MQPRRLLRRLPLAAVAVIATCCSPGAPEGGAHPEVAKAALRSRAAHPERWKRKVVLLGFDGCDGDLVEELIAKGRLPHFARLRREGARGELRSITPLLSPVIWTTVATGMPPARHGILDFVTVAGDERVPVSARMRQADTVWELLSRQGEEVGVVGWLVTWPAEPLHGFLVTERMGLLAFDYQREIDPDAPHRTWPEDLAAELADDVVDARTLPLWKVRPFADVTQKEYDDAYEPAFDPRNRLGNLRLTLATAETFRAIGERLLAERRPRFFACYFEALDALSHLFMPFAPPKRPDVKEDLYLRYRSAVEAAYVWHDRVLGEFMDIAGEDTTLIVISDHGFKSGDSRMADPSDFHATTGAMWHRLYGVFYAWGNGVRPGVRVDGATVYDIAPTVLAAMGYPVPEDMPGKVLEDAFEGGLPADTVPTYHGEQRRDELAARAVAEAGKERRPRTPEEEDQIARLESLGYIGGDRTDPASTQLNLGYNLLSQGRVEDALREFEKALALNRTTYTLAATADASLRLGRFDDAERYVRESLAKAQEDVAAFVAEHGRPPRRGEVPDDFVPKLLQVQVLAARGDLDNAVRAADELIGERPDKPQAYAVLASILKTRLDAAEKAGDAERMGDLHDRLLRAYEDCLRLEPKQPGVLYELALVRLLVSANTAEVEKAKHELDTVLELQPWRANAHNNRAIALLRLGVVAKGRGRAEEGEQSLREALASADKAIEISTARFNVPYPRAWANKAYVLWKMDRLDEAHAAARKALELDPSYVLGTAFVDALAATGRTLPPPVPKPAAPETGSPSRDR